MYLILHYCKNKNRAPFQLGFIFIATKRYSVSPVSPPQSLLNQLRAIFDQIIEFQSAQDSLYRSALEELSLRLQFDERKQKREDEVGQWWRLVAGKARRKHFDGQARG